MHSKMKPGDKVTVFVDPMTEEKVEGLAQLVRLLEMPLPGERPALESWRVHFEGDDNGTSYGRMILQNGANSRR